MAMKILKKLSCRYILYEVIHTMNVVEQKINIDETYMNVIKFGNGNKNLVIIAGVSLCGLEGLGSAIAEQYKAFQDEYTVYVMDRKKELVEGYRVVQMAEDLYRVLRELHINKTYLYGVSQGGMIAQCIAAYHSDIVEKMVVCSSQCRITETEKEIVKTWVELAEKKNVVDINRYFFEKVYSKRFLEKNKELLPELEKQGTESDCERFKVLAAACGTFDIYDDMDKIKCPTFVIGDINDNVLGVEGSYDIADRLKCKSFIYEEYSHAVYDEAEDIQEKILKFFEEEPIQ